MKRIGPGRPKLPKSKKVNATISIRLTNTQNRQLNKQAKAMAMPISAYVRGLIFGFEEAE